MNTDNVLMRNTDVEKRGRKTGEMDFTDRAVFGQQMGETAASVDEERDEGERGGEGGRGSSVFPELRK